MYALAEYGERCAAPMTGLGWANGFFGLGLTPAQRKATALAKRTAAQQKRAAKRAARIAGRTVHTSNPNAVSAMNAFLQKAQSDFKSTMADASAASRQINSIRAARTPQARQQARAAALAAVRRVNTRAAALSKSLIAGGAKPKAGMRGLGYVDPATGIDDGSGYIDPSQGDIYGGGFDPNQYQPGGVGPVIQPGFDATSLTTGLVPGFGSPFGGSPFGGGLQSPRGCATGSNLPRCLIYQMAVDEQQQFYFVFSILQQMYAQLLQIVQQLMQQLQQAQQQPGYPYQGYGPTQYDPYGQQYGAAGPYGGPYGQPGIPYYPGGDVSAIPPGYGGDSGPFDAGGAFIPNDITQVFPGPSGMGPIAPPSQPTNIISSDSLPDGAGPSTDPFGDSDTPVPAFQQAQAPTPGGPVSSSASQPVSAGPNMPSIVIQLQQPGQSAYADAQLPADSGQNQPTLEPPEPGEVEQWAQSEFA